jgi:hypothetical protein
MEDQEDDDDMDYAWMMIQLKWKIMMRFMLG